MPETTTVAPAADGGARQVGRRRILLAAPRSFCAGVERAIDVVERAIDRYGAPVYVRRQIVHNTHVVQDLETKGAVFVEELAQVPDGSVVVLAAHGVAPEVRADADRRGLFAIDATCPLVAKVHREARRYADGGYEVVLVGHPDHEEIVGTVGEAPAQTHVVERVSDVANLSIAADSRVAYITQTTLATDETAEVVAALHQRFPTLEGPRADDICYATQNRQDAVKKLLGQCDVLLVVGSRTSSNSNRLRELADRAGVPGYLIDGPEDLRAEWFTGKRAVGVTAGASAPELLVQQVVDTLARWGGERPQEVVGREERVFFTLPRELRRADNGELPEVPRTAERSGMKP
jgi:4-hydroxy-3-methylbut-2-enyl diphosphate reductase